MDSFHVFLLLVFTASFQLAASDSTDDKLKDLEQRIKKLELLESRVKALEAEDKKLREYIDCKVNITYTYKVSENAMNWTDAREFCIDLGGDLAMVGVKKWNVRQEIANRYLNSTKERFWIGAKKEGTGWHRSSFKWNNGKKVLRKNIHWSTFQPDNYLDSEECVEILYNADELDHWNWHANDHDCQSTDARALCEIPDC